MKKFIAVLLTAALAVSPLAYANCKHCKCNKKHTRHHKSSTTTPANTSTMQKSEATQNAQNPASVGAEQPAAAQ